MRIKNVELYKVALPLRFIFKTSKTVMKVRESIIVRVSDTSGYTGYGEVVSFNEPFYTKETLSASWDILTQAYIPQLLTLRLEHPFDIHAFMDMKYPMAAAGLENALLDLYTRSKGIPILSVLGEETSGSIAAGIVLGELPVETIWTQIRAHLAQGITRFKIKIHPGNAYNTLSDIRAEFPDITLLADANGSFLTSDVHTLKKLDQLGLSCIEEPFHDMSLQELAFIQKQLVTPICLDESIQTLSDLKQAIHLSACKVLNLKIGRVGGLYYAREMIQLCRTHGIGYWIGSMMESGISKILHVHLASLKDTWVAGDLSASSRYFEQDLIVPEISVTQGRIPVPTGPGLGVCVDEDALMKFTVQSCTF